MYVDNFRIRDARVNEPINTQLFCSYKNYYVYVCNNTEGHLDVRINTLKDDLHKGYRYICSDGGPKSRVFTKELGFKKIMKVRCVDYPIIIGIGEDGKNIASIYDVKIPFLSSGVSVEASGDFITKRNILLDVEKFDDTFDYFDVIEDKLNLEEISGRSFDKLKVAIV